MKRSMILVVVLGTMLVQGTAFGAAQTKAQQKCINGMNKGMAKVAGAQNKAHGKCTSTRAKDGTSDADTCAQTDAKVTAAQTKVTATDTKLCAAGADFAYSGPGSVNSGSEFESNNFAFDVFGFDVNGIDDGITLCGTDKAGCKCQGKAFKAAGKVYKARLKEFNKCKKAGLKNKATPFDDVGDLFACVVSDSKGKIGKAESKLDKIITKKCTAVTNPFPNTNSQCDTLNGAALQSCLVKRVRCHTCLTEDISDNLGVNCDDVDDDLDNGSCLNDF